MKLNYISNNYNAVAILATTAICSIIFHPSSVVSSSEHDFVQAGQNQKERREGGFMDVVSNGYDKNAPIIEQKVNEFGEKEVQVNFGVDATLPTGVKLWSCQGDCDADSDCYGTLKCFQRYSNEPVLGCYGWDNEHLYYAVDFCYDPLFENYTKNDVVATNLLPLQTIVPVDDDPDETNTVLEKCQGHCRTDDDCNGSNLKCLIRNNETDTGANDAVPGCTGLLFTTANTNYCYDPADNTTSYWNDPENHKICLYQDDFKHGTVIIRIPGYYTLCEDIQFCPNVPSHYDIKMPDTAYDPILPSPIYDESAYALGFFSAISMIVNSTTLDLNTYSIQQCESFSVMQRFFSIVELAGAPFIKNKGPANFVGPNSHFECGNNITIKGPGTMGRSSHHAIHGNQNINIVIKDITFENFEVAAVSLNKVDGLVIENCDINGNRKDVPVVGMFSAARFIRPYVKYLKSIGYSMKIKNQLVNASELFDELIVAINSVYNDVLGFGQIDQEMHPEFYELFHNPNRVIDGPCYAFLVHGMGPAINGFGDEFPIFNNLTSSNITIRNNRIRNMRCFNNEVPVALENGTCAIDARGSVFQLINTQTNKGIALNTTDGTYVRNIVADCQVMVGKAILDGEFRDVSDDPLLATNISAIPKEIIEWAEGIPNKKTGKPPTFKPKYRCGGDSMHHVAKGMVMIRLEQTYGYTIENNTIDDVVNLSKKPFDDCYDYHALQDPENANQTQIAYIRGISISGSRPYYDNTPSVVRNNALTNFISENAPVIVGIDIQGDTKGLLITDNFIDLNSNVADQLTDAYVALIIGEHADDSGYNKTIVLNHNTFMQEQLIENIRTSRGLRANYNPHHRRIGEWKVAAAGLSENERRNLGGCPFANGL